MTHSSHRRLGSCLLGWNSPRTHIHQTELVTCWPGAIRHRMSRKVKMKRAGRVGVEIWAIHY
jgi:hypothetical protein